MTTYRRRELLKKGAGLGAVAFGAPMMLAACTTPASVKQETTWEKVKRLGIVRAGFSNDYPFSLAADTGVTGQDPETLRAIMKGYGVNTVEGILFDFPGLIPGLLADRMDIIAGTLAIRPARCQQVAYANPDFQSGEALIVRKGNPLNLHSYDDLKNPAVRIGALAAGVEFDYLTNTYKIPTSQISTFPNNQLVYAALQAGRVDAFPTPAPYVVPELTRLNDPNLERATPFKNPIVGGKEVINYSASAFRKPDTDFIDAYNVGLAKVIASGELLTILKKFGMGESEMPTPGVTPAQLCAG